MKVENCRVKVGHCLIYSKGGLRHKSWNLALYSAKMHHLKPGAYDGLGAGWILQPVKGVSQIVNGCGKAVNSIRMLGIVYPSSQYKSHPNPTFPSS